MSNDRIAYLFHQKPGGIDGMDASDKGGQLTFATFDASVAEAQQKKDPWSSMTKVVVDEQGAVKDAIKKLTPLDLLVLGLRPVIRIHRNSK